MCTKGNMLELTANHLCALSEPAVDGMTAGRSNVASDVKRLILRIPSVYGGTSVSSAKIHMTAHYRRGSGLASIFAPRVLHFSAIHMCR